MTVPIYERCSALRNRKLGSPSFEKGENRVGEVENHSAPDFFFPWRRIEFLKATVQG